MFLKPTAKPTPRRTPSPRVVLPAPPGSRIASRGSSSGVGRRHRRAALDHLGDRQRAGDHLARRKRVAAVERVQQPQLDRIELERRRELVHLRLGGEARLHRAEAAHRAARRVVRVDRQSTRSARSERCTARTRRPPRSPSPRSSSRRMRRRRAGCPCGRRRAGRRASRGAPPGCAQRAGARAR